MRAATYVGVLLVGVVLGYLGAFVAAVRAGKSLPTPTIVPAEPATMDAEDPPSRRMTRREVTVVYGRYPREQGRST